jgi:hypothetical protein
MGFLAEIVLESFAKCPSLLFLPSVQDFFPPPVVHIRRGNFSATDLVSPQAVGRF